MYDTWKRKKRVKEKTLNRENNERAGTENGNDGAVGRGDEGGTGDNNQLRETDEDGAPSGRDLFSTRPTENA